MSHDATHWARKQTTGNTPAKFLLMTLADYADAEGCSWPGQERLAEITEMSERTVRRATELLIDLGLLRIFYRYRADHSRRSIRYQLLIDGPDTALPETVDWRTMKQTDSPPDTGTGGTGQADQPNRTQRPVIPSKDPSVDPSPVIPGAAPTPRATRITEDFQPDEKMRAWFAAEQLGQIVDGRTEHAKFVDYWLGVPGAKGRKLDWAATWRVWMRTAADRAPHRPGNGLAVPTSGAPRHYPSTTDAKIQQTLALAEKYRLMEENQ